MPAATTPPPGVAVPAITVVKTGGIAGVKDTLQIEPNGSWTLTGKTGAAKTGRLSADDVTALKTLAADPRLLSEASATRPPTVCRDAFDYTITVGSASTSYTDCPSDPDQPVATMALVDKLFEVTVGQ